MRELILTLPKERQHAIEILRVFIDCYNSEQGTGLFSGISRYSYLESRCEIAAIQARDLMSFWSGLRQKLKCPIPPKKADALIMPLWTHDQPYLVLKELATKAAECIMFARLLHSQDKAERRELWKETQLESSVDEIDDSLSFI